MRLHYLTIVEGTSVPNPVSYREIIAMCREDRPFEDDEDSSIRDVLKTLLWRRDTITYRMYVPNHPLIFVAALFDGRIIGSAVIFHKGEDRGNVCSRLSKEDYLAVYVKPRYRFRGVGRKLVRKALRYAKKKSAVEPLGAWDGESIGFYQKLNLPYRQKYKKERNW